MNIRKLLTRLVSLALIAVFLPTVAMADTWYLEDGSITVSATDSGQNVSQGGVTKEDSAPVIRNRDSSASTTNNVTIRADTGATANVTLEDTNIDTTGGAGPNGAGDAAVRTEGAGNVNLNVELDNTLQSGSTHAGVEKGNGGNLTIGSESGSGQLVATGGSSGAGIGGGENTGAENITITGGDIFATGNHGAAGIGGGWRGNGTDITITGGNITAVGKTESSRDVGGAGIGGGGNQTPDPGIGSNIKITGGSVMAVGGNYAAGIGGSYLSKGENITIIDAEVIAKGGANGAGIGGGDSGDGSNISISGNANVKAAGGASDGEIGDGAAIGAGGIYRNGQPVRGEERDVNTSGLTGSIDRLPAGTTFDIPQPKPRSSFPKPAPDPVAVEEEPQPVKAALYRVIDDAGKALPVETKQEDGVLLLTAQADIAILEGAISGLQTLQSRGIDTITFTNGTISVSFSLAEVIAKGASSDVYRLTLSGGEANFTLADADITALLGK
ncbi:MAG: hypothetical protein HPZ81_08805 [Oscillospiraceae bacterium]|nr:hypothetical protein [Oscillospiraceae bacterium]